MDDSLCEWSQGWGKYARRYAGGGGVVHITEQELFGETRVPVHIAAAHDVDVTPRVLAECVKVIFVVDGWARIVHGGGELYLEPGSVLTLPERAWAQGFPLGFTRTVTLYMHAEFLRTHLQWLPTDHPIVHQLLTHPIMTGTPGLVHLGERSLRVLRPKLLQLHALQAAPAGEFATLARLAEIFDDVVFLSAAGSPGASGTHAGRSVIPREPVLKAVYLVHERLDYPWRVDELSRLVALSPSQLTRLFRQDLGVSPAAFVWNARTDRMAELLASSDSSVAEAAEAAGWANSSAAVRGFKRRYGVTPRPFALHLRSLGLSALGLDRPVPT